MDPTDRAITKIVRDEQRFSRLALKDAELELSMCTFLHAVRRHPGIGQDALAEKLCLDKTTVAHRAAQLERRGYLTRSTDPADGRKKRLFITPKTERFKASLVAIETRYYDWVTQDVDSDKLSVFLEVLEQIHARGKQAREDNFSELLQLVSGAEENG